MKKGTKGILSILLVGVLLGLSACGSKGGTTAASSATPAGDSSAPGASAAPAGAGKVITVKITSCTTNDPITYSMDQFKKKLEAKTNGRMKVEVFPSCQLGSSDQMVQQVSAGNVQIFATPSAFLSGIDEMITVIDLPYLWPDVKAAVEYLNADGKKFYEDRLNKKGITSLGYYEYGPRVLLLKKNVKSLADFKGVKIRTMQAPVLADEIKYWGGAGIPMGVPELYTAIQQGTIDGIESGPGFFYSGKYFESAKYVLMEPKGALVEILMASKKWLETLPTDLQKAVTDTTIEITNDVNNYSRTDTENSLKKMKDAGLQLIEPSTEFHKELVDASAPTYTKLQERVAGSKELIDQIKAKFAK